MIWYQVYKCQGLEFGKVSLSHSQFQSISVEPDFYSTAAKMSVSNRDPASNQLEEFKKKKGVSDRVTEE